MEIDLYHEVTGILVQSVSKFIIRFIRLIDPDIFQWFLQQYNIVLMIPTPKNRSPNPEIQLHNISRCDHRGGIERGSTHALTETLRDIQTAGSSSPQESLSQRLSQPFEETRCKLTVRPSVRFCRFSTPSLRPSVSVSTERSQQQKILVFSLMSCFLGMVCLAGAKSLFFIPYHSCSCCGSAISCVDPALHKS